MKRFFKSFVFLGFFLMAMGAAFAADKLSKSQLESLVAPIALYPDPLLAQILPASTYPLQIVEAAKVVKGEKDFSKIDGKDWDASVKAVARYPDVLKQMNTDIRWTESLGRAVLAQQKDVLKTVQTLRKKAKKSGSLATTPQTLVRETSRVVEIVPANPEVIYVPVYDPAVVYVMRPRHVHYVPAISYGVGFRTGTWFDLGFAWTNYRVAYASPYWWRSGWRGHHHRYYDFRRAYAPRPVQHYYDDRRWHDRGFPSRPAYRDQGRDRFRGGRDDAIERRRPSRDQGPRFKGNFHRPGRERMGPSMNRGGSRPAGHSGAHFSGASRR